MAYGQYPDSWSAKQLLRGFERERRVLPKGRIRTKEEFIYFRRFQKSSHSDSCYDEVGITNPL